MSKVSIIVPLYNKEKYILNTLRSLSVQTFEDFEVWVIDDGSTDSGRKLAEQYAWDDERIQVISIPNGGVSNARNVGLRKANGEWIQFLDADDTIDSDYLSQVFGHDDVEKVDIVFTNFWMVDVQGNKLKKIENFQIGLIDGVELCRNYMNHQLRNGFFGYISNKLFRKSLLEKTNAIFPVDIKLAEDLDFYVHLYAGVENAYFLPVVSFYYLQTESNYLYNSSIDYFSQLKVQMDIRNWFLQLGQYDYYQEKLEKRISEYVYFFLFHSYENTPEKIEECYQRIVGNPVILLCVHPEYVAGFARMLLEALKRKSFWGVKVLLEGRNCLRTIYRKSRKNG